VAWAAPGRGRHGHRHRSAHPGHRRQDEPPQPRPQEGPRFAALGDPWASEFGLTLGQVTCSEKPHEITAIPELLRLIDAKGAIITIDAMGTQKAIADEVIRGGADYVLALKGNQETMHEAVIALFDKHRDEGDTASELVTEEKGHGRVEQRSTSRCRSPRICRGTRCGRG
jgi:predicted transposase YbfD/YdcC